VRRSFRRGAYLANQIEHPGVVRVLEDGETPEGTPYIAMELLDGESLETRRTRKGGFLPLAEVMWIADETLAIVAAAHDKHIVHRDIKPENLFLTSDARIKILDFGIARAVLGADGLLTRAGTVLGTVGYMAPEQARGEVEDVKMAADIYAVGATMFTLLSGRLVRDHDAADAVTTAGKHKVPSLGAVAPSVPAAVVGIVDAALSFDPEIRWPTAIAMRRALHVAYAEMRREAARPEPAGGAPTSEPSYDFRHARPIIEAPPLSIRASTRPAGAPPRPPLTVHPPAMHAGLPQIELDLPSSPEILLPRRKASAPPPAPPPEARRAHRRSTLLAVMAVTLSLLVVAWATGVLRIP